MRRSVAQKGQDICIFCALRRGLEPAARPYRKPIGTRSITNNATLRRPGAAQAAQREEDDDDGPVSYQPFGRTRNSFSPQDAAPPRNKLPFRQDFGTRSEDLSQRGQDQGLPIRRSAFDRQTGRDVPPPRNTGGAGRGISRGWEDFEQMTRGADPQSAARTPKFPAAYQQPPRTAREDVAPRQANRPELFQGVRRVEHGEGLQPSRSRDSMGSRGQRQFRESEQQLPSRGGNFPRPARQEDSTLDDIDRDGDRETQSGHRRRGAGQKESSEERRARRFATAGDEEPESRNKKSIAKMSAEERRKQLLEEQIEAELLGEGSRRSKRKEKPVKLARPRVDIPEYMSVSNLAGALDVKVNVFLERLEEEGYEGARHDHILDGSTSAMFAELYGFDPVMTAGTVKQDLVARPPAEDQSLLPSRPPIVTIMGHVDHGKTTILDFLRKSSVVAGEHGGITQHIGAFSVTMPATHRQITFLDTPGHAAFLDMRRRGAVVTDIVVLVVAADDSVMPQTIEAIKHAKESNVHIIVAINKIDKEDANVQKVKEDLARQEVYVEDFNGDIQAIPLSGKTGKGMDDLEEAIITLADVSDVRAEIDGPAEGWVIESKVTAAGRVATVLVRRGTLRTGDFIVAGSTWARVRTLRNDAGLLVSEAPPGTPVQVDGWRNGDPTAGLEVLQADDEQHAKEVVELREEKEQSIRSAADTVSINKTRAEEAEAQDKVMEWRREQGYVGKRTKRMPRSVEGWVEGQAKSGPKEVAFVIKADVAGSAEAITAAVSAIGNQEVVANVVHSGTGNITESDIKLLAGTGETGYAISFNQSVDPTMYRLAEAAELQILDHNIIYKVTDEVMEKLSDELPPKITQKVLGEAEIGKVFEVTMKKKTVKIAGCKVTNGSILRSQKIRVSRNAEVIYTGTLDSLKNVKKDVTEMRKGTECGMSFDNWDDFQEGDQIQSFEEIKEKRKLY